MTTTKTPFVSTTNACKLCMPLGATVAFRGIEGCVPFLHGSQGCATYMRRYIISHFREPRDIASSSLGEKSAIYGGGPNLKQGILNVMQKYEAKVIGVATTCLTETIGDDLGLILHEFRKEFAEFELPTLIIAHTPSYDGTHMQGFHAAVRATVEQLADNAAKTPAVNLLPGFVSPEDIRHLKDIFADFQLPVTVLPDYSETLDGQAFEDYQKISPGGTPVAAIRAMGGAPATVEFGSSHSRELTGGQALQKGSGVPLHTLDMPIGLRASDAFFETLEKLSGTCMPERHEKERGRLVDAYVDGHKYISGLKAVVYGEEDLVVGLTSFLAEIGIHPVLTATGGEPAHFEEAISRVTEGLLPKMPLVRTGVDFYEIAAQAEELRPDLLIGNSKGYRIMAKETNVPLIRVGFPVHDRFGAQRILHLGYKGTQRLYDEIVNAVLAKKQSDSDVGYGYL